MEKASVITCLQQQGRQTTTDATQPLIRYTPLVTKSHISPCTAAESPAKNNIHLVYIYLVYSSTYIGEKLTLGGLPRDGRTCRFFVSKKWPHGLQLIQERTRARNIGRRNMAVAAENAVVIKTAV